MNCLKRVAVTMLFSMVIGAGIMVNMVNLVYARPIGISSERKFYDKIDRKELVVALFYREDKEVNRSPAMKFQVARLKKMFDSVSKLYEFKQAEIAFLMINVAKNKVQMLPQDFDVNQLPTIVLFKGGEPVFTFPPTLLASDGQAAKASAFVKAFADSSADKMGMLENRGTIARLVGFVSRDSVIDFVNQYFSDRIDDIMDEKAKIREQQAIDRAYWPYYGWPYWGTGYGYGYPYYGGAWYGYPYFDGLYRPYVGVGFGW